MPYVMLEQERELEHALLGMQARVAKGKSSVGSMLNCGDDVHDTQ